MNYEKLDGLPIRIMWETKEKSKVEKPECNVFVNNLDKDIDEKTLYDRCTIIGAVESCKIQRNSKGKSCGYGYIQFEDKESAKQAIEELNGSVLSKNKIYACTMEQNNDSV